jgi:hypothetical protein
LRWNQIGLLLLLTSFLRRLLGFLCGFLLGCHAITSLRMGLFLFGFQVVTKVMKSEYLLERPVFIGFPAIEARGAGMFLPGM